MGTVLFLLFVQSFFLLSCVLFAVILHVRCVTVDLNMVDPDDDIIYMNGNSLGAMPKKAIWYCEEILYQWGDW